ncbi:hypothetical protein NQZ68_004062, partial [Dissostichus eleginoides]
MFNLDRFRYDKKTTKDNEEDSGSQSPESEKENKPAKMKPVKAQTKSNARGVVFEEVLTIDLEEDELISETKNKTLARKFKNPIGKSSKNVASDHADDEDCELKEKTDRLLEMFPQLTRTQVLEVIKNTNTLDGAAAECILRFGDKEAPDQGRKRKQDGSGSSQDSGEDQPSKKNRPLEVSDEEDEEDKCPSREKKQAMVRKLQKKFPDQDKEELRMVLQEHDWNVEDALQVLQMFSDPGTKKKSRKSKSKETSSKDHRKSRLHKDHRDSKSRKKSEDEISSESEEDNKGDPEGDAEVTQDSEDSDSDSSVDSRNKRSTSTLVKSPDLVSSSTSVKKFTTSAFLMPSSSTSTAQMLSRFASGTSIAKKQAAERKKKVLASDEHVSSEGENDDEEETVSSEFEDSDEELDCKGGMTDLKKEMLQFFQDATIDELSLISGCSVKKAKKILERRPFEGWQSLVDVFTKDKGLSENLLMGCRVVLKERKVVLGLMSKCQTISSKMVRQVTAVMERGTAAMKQPKLLNRNNQLKPYQLIGLKWMLLMYEHKLSGILADEMGLGKTIQAIAFLAELYQMGIEGPHLIIVPASTLDNWVREMKLWCPSLKVVVYCGSLEDRRYLRHELLDDKTEYNVIVTTYNMAIGNDNDRGVFRKLRLKYALFDEGHMLKNMNSLRYRHLMSINAEHRMLLTGTPLQNNLLELMSLLNFIMPSLFSSSTHQLSKMFQWSVFKSHEEQSRFERDRISQAKLIMKPFILRRVKSEVLKQLPAKVEKVESCPMSEKQQVLYQNMFKKLKTTNIGEKRELCNVMMQLRKMANHPLLHRQYYTTEKLKAMSKLMLKEPTHFDANAVLIQEDMEAMSDFELHLLCKQFSSIGSYQLETELLLDSGKFHHLTELLASHKNKGDRVVLFSQFTMMLDIVEVLMRHLKHRYVRLDGSTPIADRTVQVTKLISKDSIEAIMLQLGQKKLKLEQDMTAAE